MSALVGADCFNLVLCHPTKSVLSCDSTADSTLISYVSQFPREREDIVIRSLLWGLVRRRVLW